MKPRLLDDRFHDGKTQKWLIVTERGSVIEAWGATEFGAVGTAFLDGAFQFGDHAYSITPLTERIQKNA